MQRKTHRDDKFCNAMMHCIVGISNLTMSGHNKNNDTTIACISGSLIYTQTHQETISEHKKPCTWSYW